MATISKPDFIRSTRAAHMLLKKNNITTFPTPLFNIFNNIPEIKIFTFEEMSKMVGVSSAEIGKKMALSEEGAIGTYGLDQVIIIYNSNVDEKNIERMRFTLAHELGHYILGHPYTTDNSVLSRNGVTEEENQCFEIEANNFAKELLAPSFIVNALNDFSIDNISRAFEISKSSSELSYNYVLDCRNRYERNRWLKPPNFFSDDLKKIKIKKRNNLASSIGLCYTGRGLHFENKKVMFCPKCKSVRTFNSKFNFIFCPCCSNEEIRIIDNYNYFEFHETEAQTIMSYTTLNVDNDGRLIQNCPICDNPNIRDNYCSVCGVNIINRCSGEKEEYYDDGRSELTCYEPCEGALYGGDRFCPKCGGVSTFFKDKLLLEWNYIANPFKTSEILFDIKEEDLPF